jgi:hypothetical protein
MKGLSEFEQCVNQLAVAQAKQTLSRGTSSTLIYSSTDDEGGEIVSILSMKKSEKISYCSPASLMKTDGSLYL